MNTFSYRALHNILLKTYAQSCVPELTVYFCLIRKVGDYMTSKKRKIREVEKNFEIKHLATTPYACSDVRCYRIQLIQTII